MPPIPFTPRRPKPRVIQRGGVRIILTARSPAVTRALAKLPSPECDVRLAKDTRTRRYLIVADAKGYVCDVWFGRGRHRHRLARDWQDAKRMRQQYTREIRDLLTDGWTIADGNLPAT